MRKWTEPKSLSLLLLVAGLVLGAVSLAFMIMPRLSLGLMHLTCAVFLVRAVAEWFRPHNQWARSLLNGFIVAVAFACFLPAWAKIAHEHDLRHLVMPALVMGVLGMNLGVPLLKAAIHLVRKLHSRCVVP